MNCHHETPATDYTGVVLAAGAGTRFDPSGRTSKLMATWRGMPLAWWAARSLLPHCTAVFAVVRPELPELADLLDEAGCICVSPAGHRPHGMGSSIAAGARAVSEWHDAGHQAPGRSPEHSGTRTRSGVLLLPGDMPLVRGSTIERLIEGHGRHDVVAPSYMGRLGHPVLFDRTLLPALSALRGDKGAKSIRDAACWSAVDIDDPGVLCDIDTIDDLDRIQAIPRQAADPEPP